MYCHFYYLLIYLFLKALGWQADKSKIHPLCNQTYLCLHPVPSMSGWSRQNEGIKQKKKKMREILHGYVVISSVHHHLT